jgi:hypothetical protein
LSYVLLSLFEGGKINGKKITALLIGVLMNPILVAILFKIDEHITNKIMLSISLMDRTLPAYMFNWSSVVFTGQRSNVPAEMLVAHISNTILYFALSYGLLSLIGKISIASGSESDSRLKNTKQKVCFNL